MNSGAFRDEDVFAAVGSSLRTVQMRRSVDEITARGRGVRARRRKVTGAVTAGALGMSLAVAVPLSGAGDAASGSRTLRANGHVVNVDMAGWSVHTGANSIVTVTLNQLFDDPAALQHALNRAGVRAMVRSVGVHDPEVGCSQRGVTTLSDVRHVFTVHAPANGTGDQVVRIDPAGMPGGSVLELVTYHQPLPELGGNSEPNGRGDQLETLIVTLLSGDPGECVPAPPTAEYRPPSALSGRK